MPVNHELRLSEWYLRHKLGLEKLGIGLLIAWCVATIGFGLWGWGYYLFFGYWQDQNMLISELRQYTNYTLVQPLYREKDLVTSDVSVFQSADGVYSFVADVNNPNPDAIVKVTYSFSFAGGETMPDDTVLLPGERRMGTFGIHLASGFPTGVSLNIRSVEWKRIAHHYVPLPADYISARLMFATDHFVFSPPNTAEGRVVPSVAFDITNASAYSYWQPVFYVELYSGDTLVGVAYTTVSQFQSGNTSHLDLRLFGDTLHVTDIRVVPVINIFDPTVYMAPAS